jgi:hypothetical protein
MRQPKWDYEGIDVGSFDQMFVQVCDFGKKGFELASWQQTSDGRFRAIVKRPDQPEPQGRAEPELESDEDRAARLDKLDKPPTAQTTGGMKIRKRHKKLDLRNKPVGEAFPTAELGSMPCDTQPKHPRK